MNEKEIKQRILSGEFANNNGKIIRTINILNGDWIELDTIRKAQPTIDAGEFNQSMVYLERGGYIEIRDAVSKAPMSAEAAKLRDGEAILSARGIKLAMGFVTDEAIDI